MFIIDFIHSCIKCSGKYTLVDKNIEDLDKLCPHCLLHYKKFNKNNNDNSQSYSRYISSDVKQTVWKRDNGRCVCCNSLINLEYDHIIPISKGGSNFENNIQILCYDCNRTKSNKIL